MINVPTTLVTFLFGPSDGCIYYCASISSFQGSSWCQFSSARGAEWNVLHFCGSQQQIKHQLVLT